MSDKNNMEKSDIVKPALSKADIVKAELAKDEINHRFRAPGISKLEATSLFRYTNFELFTRPNALVMALGVACFTGALSYIAYLNYQVSLQYL